MRNGEALLTVAHPRASSLRMWTLVSPDPDTTRALGRTLGRVAGAGVVVALVGDLGAGKTCFAQGVGQGLEVADAVVSPTFVLIAEHEGRLPLLHADAYRLAAHELPGLGLEEAIEGWPGVALVEWADRFPEVLPCDRLEVHLTEAPEGRRVAIAATGPLHDAVLEVWRDAWDRR